MEKYNIKTVTKWILKKEPTTHKRLQKTLYFMYGEYLALKNTNLEGELTELFKNDFEGWAHGPVSPTVYSIFKGSSYKPLMLHPATIVEITEEDNEILDRIYNKYLNHSTDELEEISHAQEPWINSRIGMDSFAVGNRQLSTVDIFNCFNNNE